MALSIGAAIQTWNFSDNNFNDASTSLYQAPTFLLVEYVARMNALRDVMRPLSNARLDGGTLTFDLIEDAAGIAPPESEVERKLVLVFDVGNGRGTVRQEIPSPVFSLETAGTDNVDPANPLLAAYVTAVLSGPIGPGNGTPNQYGVDLTGLRSARIVHRTRGTRGR